MNKIYKVMYSKVKQCAVVVSEIAKSHGHNGESSGVRKHAALTAAVLIALGSLSFTTAFVPMTAEAADKTRTDGSNFVGVERTDGLFEDSDYANHNGQGAHGDDSITIGLKASGGDGTITIGDRRAEKSLGSVYVGRGPGMPTGKVLPSETDDGYWATSVGYQSDATGYGSIAIGSNATANNSYDKDSTGHGIDLKTKSGDGKSFVLKGKPDIQRASVAIGYGASADNGNIAIGSYSDASTDLRTAKTKDGKEIKSYLTDKMADSYVSVGDGKDHSETQYRRISNVADGASASDVATVGQLQALSDKVGVYDAGFGIEIASDKDNKTNTISLNRNLGTNYTDKAHHGDEKVTVAVDDTGLVLGGYAEDEKGNKKNPAVTYGATGDDSVTVGGMNSLASGRGSVVTGGVENIASGATAVAIGGNNNDAIGTRSAVLGGLDNTAFGSNSMVSGGSYNVAGGIQSAVLGGFSNYALGTGTTSIGGYGKDYETGYDSSVNGDYSVGVAGGSTGKDAKYALAAGHQAVVTTENGTAIGYQATTDEAKTIAFGHDAGDVSGYTIEWNQLPKGQVNADGTANDYTKAPKSVTPTTYKDAYYNRLVKVADGQDDHDVVVMEQLTKATNDLTKDLSVYAGWGIDIVKNNKNGNLISLQRNLGNIVKVNGERSPSVEVGRYAFILGGEFNNYRSYYNRTPLRNTKWGARGDNSVVVGGFDNLSSGRDSVELGGFLNEANGTYSSVLGGEENITKGSYSTVIGGWDNYAYGTHSTVVGGYGNVAYDNSAVIGGGGNRAGSCFDGTSISDAIAIGGAGNQAAGSSSVALGGYGANVFASGSTGIAGGSTGFEAYEALAAGYNSTVTVAKGTAIGYTATTNEKGTIAFGHDKGDTYYDGDARYFVGSGTFSRWPQKAYRVSQNFYDANGKQITEKEYMALMNPDYTWNDYNKRPYFEETYTSAYYNRLVKVADGQKAHDTVVMEQLTPYTRSDASNIGANLKTYTVGEDGETITEANATADEKKANENAWGEAIGTGKIADPDASDKETNGSQQLVTGSTVYNEVRPSKDGKYVKMSQTTGDNLLKLDDQVKTNTDTLSDVDSRSVKYDTKTENGKTFVDNTKITLAGEGGTTITNLKDGVNANDAAIMGQLNDRISGVTYKAGDGIKYGTDADNNKTISVNKGDGLKFTEDHKLAVNTGKHLSVNTNGQIDVGDNGTVAENDGNLVTGDTVYKALNGGMTKMIIGTPGKDGKDGKDGTPGTIGLVGPAGTNGKDGAVDITIQKGEDGKDGTKGANGVDGKDGINRIVYEDKNGKHQVATMEDGLKFAGDDGQNDATKAIAKKLNNTVDIIGGAKGDLTEGNIGVNNDSGKLKIQLAQELTGITSISGSTGSNGAKITLDTNDQNISVNGGKITDVASGLSTNDGSYNAKDAKNAANISDVNSMISKAVTDAKGETQQNLDKKANVDASNIGTNLKGADGKTAATEDEQKANLDKWGEAIGTGEVKDGSKQLVTGNTVYNAVKDKADKSYVDTQLNTKANTDGSNIDADKFSKKVAIGKINDSDERAVSGKTVHEAIQTINGNIDGKANKNLDNIDDAGKNVIKDQARAAVTIDNKGLNTNVVATQDDKNHTTTYTINVEGNGKVAAKDTGLISGDTIYNELRPATDGSYIKQTNTTAQNLTSLDTQVRATHDLINSDGKTIKIGGSDAATKIDVNGNDGKGRVITGVVSDANDPTSAANVGYVNGVTAANTQQIYRDMNNAYGRLNNNINKAAAGSNALAALHPLDYDPDDKADFAVGYGHYRNANAAAVGAFYHPNENTMVNVGVSLGNGDPGFNAGVSFKVGRGGAGREAMSKTEMAKVINSQSKEIDALKKDNADKDKRIDALEQKMAEILAKLDKNGK